MAKKYLDDNGLLYFWQKIKNLFVAKESGKGLSTNDYTTTEKEKLAGIAAGAEVNVQSDWNATSGDAFIKNKPSIPTKTSDLTNDSDFVSDANYVHTDSNYTAAEKSKLSGVALGATKNTASSTTPKMDGTAAVGTESNYARGDHVHPTDTSRASASDLSALQTTVGNKVDKVTGKGLSTNDYTTDEKNKLSGIAAGAEVNVQADWDEDDSTSDAYIKNKPTIPTVPVTSVAGKTGAVTLDKSDVGLGNVDNTADANKSVSSAATLTTKRTIDGVEFNGSGNIIHFGTCSTAAGTAAKTVSCSGFKLASGAWIAVKFSNTNSAAVANLTLNVNSTGAKSIKYQGGNLPSVGDLHSNGTYMFVYDGTNYNYLGTVNTQYAEMFTPNIIQGTDETARVIAPKTFKEAVNLLIDAAKVGAAMFQGTVNAGTDISDLTAYKKGWYWVVATAGTYVGQTCEVGDMIFCISDYGTAYSADDFSVVQNNLDIVAITNAEIDTIVAS